jgi:hypothetical protein
MIPDDHARAMHLLQQMGPAKGNPTLNPYQPPFSSIEEATILTAQVSIEVLVVAAAAAAIRTRRVAEFTTAAGPKAHASAIAAIATEQEAAQPAQATARAALANANATIAEADATASTA